MEYTVSPSSPLPYHYFAQSVGIGTTSPFSKLQVGNNTFSGGNGMHNDTRVGISNHGILTGMMLASTYNDAAHPEYGLVFVQGPSTSSYNVWSISPDGPAKGSSLIFNYQAQSTNIHSPANAKVCFQGSTGRVGIGTTSPTAKLTIDNGSASGGSLLKSSNSSYTAHFIANTGTGSAGIYMDAMNGDFIGSDYGFIGQNNAGYMEYTVSPSSPLPYHYFAQNVGIGITSPTAKIHVVGTASVPAARLYGTGGTIPPLQLRQDNTAGWFTKFYSDNFGTYIGGISFYGSTTTFSTSSDYRLKENIIPISDSITRLKQLKPSRFNFKQYPEITIDGFLAHEVQDIVPEAVTGDKDELDLSGKPVYQAIDHSRLIPLLVASIQELELRVKELENK
jgi:hypothetical protein